MSQFAAFSPFELPSFEKVKKGRYQRVGGNEPGRNRVEGASCVCASMCLGSSLCHLRATVMWGVFVGTESFKPVSQ